MRGLLLFTVLSLMCLFRDAQGMDHTRGKMLSEVHDMDCPVPCAKCTHYADGSYSAVGCPSLSCVEEIGYHDTDLSKPYPECCARPICKERS